MVVVRVTEPAACRALGLVLLLISEVLNPFGLILLPPPSVLSLNFLCPPKLFLHILSKDPIFE